MRNSIGEQSLFPLVVLSQTNVHVAGRHFRTPCADPKQQRVKMCFSSNKDAYPVSLTAWLKEQIIQLCDLCVFQDSSRQSQSLVTSGSHAETVGRLPATSHHQKRPAQVHTPLHMECCLQFLIVGKSAVFLLQIRRMNIDASNIPFFHTVNKSFSGTQLYNFKIATKMCLTKNICIQF